MRVCAVVTELVSVLFSTMSMEEAIAPKCKSRPQKKIMEHWHNFVPA